ncbi:MAG: hypothetical protein V7K68_11170 [Nostoc sp.]|uniref:hypothetical protein n=1 Tax=Nostoc sp. TaxID=1180 RepID=UPI002FFD5143
MSQKYKPIHNIWFSILELPLEIASSITDSRCKIPSVIKKLLEGSGHLAKSVING